MTLAPRVAATPEQRWSVERYTFERIMLPKLGPGAYVVLRKLARADGCTVDLAELFTSCGLGAGIGVHSKGMKILRRLEQNKLIEQQLPDRITVTVRTHGCG